MKRILWGICPFCARFPGQKNCEAGCPVKKRSDGKWHSDDFQGIAKCPKFKQKERKNEEKQDATQD